jgi:hypothetical protein
MSNNSKIIYTHQNVDLDNTISTVAYCYLNRIPIDAEHIKFVPANILTLPINSIGIDLQISKHDPDSSYCKDEFNGILPSEIIKLVNDQDSTGHTSSELQVLLMVALKKNHLSDLAILQFFEPLVKGWIIIQSERDNALPLYQKCRTEVIGKYKFVIAENKALPASISVHAKADGCCGTIYCNGYDMGISRYPDMKVPDLTQLPKLQGWFQHKTGFLFAWGTRKAHADSYPAEFHNLSEFILWLKVEFELCNL